MKTGHGLDTLTDDLNTPREGCLCDVVSPLPTCVGGPHLCAVILIHEVGRNMSRSRGQNDTAAIHFGHAVIATEEQETAASQLTHEGVS